MSASATTSSRAALGLALALLLASCAGGPRFSELFDESAAGEGTGFQGAALVRAVVILARHEATPQQREIAVRHADRAVAALEKQIAAPPKHLAGSKTAAKKRLPDRIAVPTVKDEHTTAKAEAAVMLYDVRARRIVGNEVYDIEKEPPPGETVRFDTSVVRYVGTSY